MFNLNQTKKLNLPDGTSINYLLKKKYKLTISLRISSKGLVVSAPILMTSYQINKLLQKKSKWIQKKLLLTSYNNKIFKIKDGEKFKIFDKELCIALRTGPKNIYINKNQCFINFYDLSDEIKLKKFFIKWLKEYALKYFIQRVTNLCKKNNLKSQATFISNAKTRWGTCNSKKEIRLNWRLIQSPAFVIDYVICHELSHLKFMNHSKDFWQQVNLLFPKYKEAEKYLKENGFKLYQLD